MKVQQCKKVQQCGLCAEWTDDGENVQSGEKRGGITPMDNFICRRCEREAHGFNLLGEAGAEFLRDRGRARAAQRRAALTQGV